MKKEIHPAIAGFPMFDVGETEFDNLIGKRFYKMRDPDSNSADPNNDYIILIDGNYVQRKASWDYANQLTIFHDAPEIYTVGSIQRNYYKKLVTRIYLDGDDFGSPCDPSDLIPVLTIVKS